MKRRNTNFSPVSQSTKFTMMHLWLQLKVKNLQREWTMSCLDLFSVTTRFSRTDNGFSKVPKVSLTHYVVFSQSLFRRWTLQTHKDASSKDSSETRQNVCVAGTLCRLCMEGLRILEEATRKCNRYFCYTNIHKHFKYYSGQEREWPSKELLTS